MKYILSFGILTLLAFHTKAGKGESMRKSLPDYEVGTSVYDKTLKKTEAVFNFIFVHMADKKPVTAPITLSYNGTEVVKRGSKTGRYNLKVKPGKYKFQFWYDSKYHEIYTDSIEVKPAHRINVKLLFKKADHMIMEDKPVIYLYPEKTTEVSVTLDIPGKFLFTYPSYNEGWTVTANPDGKLQQGDKTFNYLFWEGQSTFASGLESKEGFVKNTSELTAFFEEKLAHLGLNSTEMQDFITYWVPRMQSHQKHYIRFVLNDEYNKTAKLTVSPQPDQMIRVFMLWTPLQETDHLPVKEPQLPSFKRHGFTLVEWGGAQVDMVKPTAW